MGAGAIDTGRIEACLRRLADQVSGSRKRKWRPGKGDHRLYRIKVESSEGTSEALIVMVDPGHKVQPESNLRQIADQLRVDRDRLDEVLGWSKAEFLAHCKGLSSNELKPPSLRKGAPGAAPPGSGRGRKKKHG